MLNSPCIYKIYNHEIFAQNIGNISKFHLLIFILKKQKTVLNFKILISTWILVINSTKKKIPLINVATIKS